MMSHTREMMFHPFCKNILRIHMLSLLAAILAAAFAGCGSAPLKTDELAGSRIAFVYAFENALEEATIPLLTTPGRVSERMKKMDAIFAEHKDVIVGTLKGRVLRDFQSIGIPGIAFTESDIFSDAVMPLKDSWNAGRRDCSFLKERGYTHVFIFRFSWVYSHSSLGSQAVYTGFSGSFHRVDDLMRVVPGSSWRGDVMIEKDANGVRTCPLVEFYSEQEEERYKEPAIFSGDNPLYLRVILASFGYYLPHAVESLKSGKKIRKIMQEKKVFRRKWDVDEFLKQFGGA